jgi:hypothetical protein
MQTLAHAACWSLMVLSAGCVSTGVSANGIPRNGERFPGVSQPAVSTAASPSRRRRHPPLAAPHSGN